MAGGLDTMDDDDKNTPEIYCYAPTADRKNSPVDTLFVQVRDLRRMREITEAEARKKHPALAKYLDDINAGKDP
jgi:hypothetical protein